MASATLSTSFPTLSSLPPPQPDCRSEPSSSSSPPSISSFLSRPLPLSPPPTLILRFPPNFARQLSIKARRNCSNIGVAQIVAASSVTDLPSFTPSPGSPENVAFASTTAAAAAITTKVVEVPAAANVEEAEHCTTSVNGCATAAPRAGKPFSSATLAVHGGERNGRPKVSDALITPIVQTSTYTFSNTAELIAFQEGKHTSFEYGRYGNPTTHVAEQKISALEGAETTLLVASGMCAATTMLLALVPAGGHIVTTTDCYRRTRQFIQTVLPKMGIKTTVVDPADYASLERAVDENNVSLFFSESPTNPYLRCIDIERVSKLCHSKDCLVCIDGTFATPVNQKALALGADVVLHSATKYIAGHNDVLAGSLSGSSEVIGAVRALHNILGGVIDPHTAYLILRGLKTLHLRVKQQNNTALKLAHALEVHPKVVCVHYPGLKSHPEHHIAKQQMSGYGGVVSFEIAGDLQATSKFIDSLTIPYIAPSLGGCESLVEQPTIISYWDQTPSERARLGIKDNLVRFSCGVEDFEDIHADVMQALDVI